MSLVLTMNPHGHQEHGHGFTDPDQDPWMDPQHTGYHSQHQSPVHEYPGMHFSPLQMQPLQPMYTNPSMPIQRNAHQQLQPLIMPQPQWPSMLTSQSSYNQSVLHSATIPTPSTAQTPIATPLSAPPTTGRSTAPRKTLTDADRRRMCQYSEEHPNVKQTEIGAMFGVERSTVSKVLRHREKYLSQDDGTNTTAKKAKGKFPDIERALSNWVKNQQKQGLPITDSLIREKLRVFATTMGNPENLPRTTSGSWLEKFKLKNGLLGSKSRKGSIAEESEAASNPASGVQTPNRMSESPATVNKQLVLESSTSALSESSVTTKSEHQPYRSLSTESLTTAFAAATTAFNPGPTSPRSPQNTLESSSAFVSPGQSRSPSASGTLHRPRSQTFPMLGIEPYLSPPASEPFTPKYLTSTALETQLTDLATFETRGSGNTSVLMQPPALLPSQNFDIHMQAPPAPHPPSMIQSSPITPGGPTSNPSSIPATPDHPRVEEAQRAMEVVMKYFEQNPQQNVSPQDYFLMGRLMENLRVQATQSPPPSVPAHIARAGEMPGGMHRIPSGDFKTGRSTGE